MGCRYAVRGTLTPGTWPWGLEISRSSPISRSKETFPDDHIMATDRQPQGRSLALEPGEPGSSPSLEGLVGGEGLVAVPGGQGVTLVL